MGSSSQAGNRGIPATARDGADVEIMGLLKSTLRWVSGLDRTVFRHTAATFSDGKDFTYNNWDRLLSRSFEAHFWVPSAGELDGGASSGGTRQGIYKDTLGASSPWRDW